MVFQSILMGFRFSTRHGEAIGGQMQKIDAHTILTNRLQTAFESFIL